MYEASAKPDFEASGVTEGAAFVDPPGAGDGVLKRGLGVCDVATELVQNVRARTTLLCCQGPERSGVRLTGKASEEQVEFLDGEAEIPATETYQLCISPGSSRMTAGARWQS